MKGQINTSFIEEFYPDGFISQNPQIEDFIAFAYMIFKNEFNFSLKKTKGIPIKDQSIYLDQGNTKQVQARDSLSSKLKLKHGDILYIKFNSRVLPISIPYNFLNKSAIERLLN